MPTRRFRSLLALSWAFALLGCGNGGDDHTGQTSPSGSAGAVGAGGGSQGTGGSCPAVGCPAGGTGGAGQAGVGGAAETGAGGSGQAGLGGVGGGGQSGGGQAGSVGAACSVSAPCPETGLHGSYCVYDDMLCGTGQAAGHCLEKPFDCPLGFPVLCGCDGVAQACLPAAGVDISALAGCAAPSGLFACGYQFCHQGTEACVERILGSPQSYECLSLTMGCDVSTCSCAPADCPNPTCAESNGGVTVTCMFGH